jgi:hypothetical protein
MISVGHGLLWLLGGAVIGFALGHMLGGLAAMERARRIVRELDEDSFFADASPRRAPADRKVN